MYLSEKGCESMFNVKLNSEYIVETVGTSEGTQIKYKKGGYWYKLDNRGNEGLCEYFASKFLTFTSLSKEEYVLYEQGMINGRPGCRSKDFIGDSSKELITLYRLYSNETGENLAKVVAGFDDMEDRIGYVINFVKKVCGIDYTGYLRKIITLDAIILNEDRHVNNLTLLYDGKDFRPAPIFDNGCSLLTANQSKKMNADISDNVKRVIAKPFSGSFEKQYKYFGQGFTFDKNEVLSWLETEPKSEERDILIYQVENCNL